MAAALLSLFFYNLSLMVDAVGPRTFVKIALQNGLDFDRWYPLPRRLVASGTSMRTHRRDRDHHKRTLDTIAERFDVWGGQTTDGAAPTGVRWDPPA